jgi:hypothetical protein
VLGWLFYGLVQNTADRTSLHIFSHVWAGHF